MKQLFFLLLLLCSFNLSAQQPGTWTTHLAYHDGKQAVRAGKMLYALMGSNLLSYDTASQLVLPIDRVSHRLSEKDILHIGYSPTRQVLVLLYASGNVDLFYPRSERVVNLPQLRLSHEDYMLHSLCVQGDAALISTSQGVLWIDLAREEIKGYYKVGACQTAALFDGHIYAALTEGRIKYAPITANLLDFAQWKDYSKLSASRLLATDAALFAIVPPGKELQGLWRAARRVEGATAVVQPEHLLRNNIVAAHLDGNDVHCIDYSEVFCLKNGGTQPTYLTKPTSTTALTADGEGGYWLGFPQQGYVHYKDNGRELQATQEYIGRFGPRYDSQYFMRYAGQDLLVACGRLDPDELDDRPQQAMRYDGQQWHFFQNPSAEAGYVGTLFHNATSIVQSPTQPKEYVVTTGRTGVYRYADLAIAEQWSLDNSPLQSALKEGDHSLQANYVRTDGAAFDAAGHLFLLNNAQDTCIWVRKPDGRWKGIYHRSLKQAPGLERTLIDSRGWLWVTSKRTVDHHNGGFLCLDYNQTIDNTSDDVATYRSSFTNQDGAVCSFQAALSIAEDRDGSMWLGTDQGLFKVDNPKEWSNEQFQITQIKVPRNDGTNYADYLLAGVPIMAIAIDGAGRKWIGTSSNGIYLLSADGLTTLHHFTTSNSPLYSNHIWSIACHPSNGQVMIATDKGLIAYQSDASEPAPQLAGASLRVYPNPVRPDYTGVIRLDGLSADCHIRVTNAAGLTVAGGRSQGGTFTWDGRNTAGHRVASGVYYFYIADDQAQSGAVARVAIVR